MIVVRNLRQIPGGGALSQWQGRVGEHGSISIRYRWGLLTARISETSNDLREDSQILFEEEVGEKMGSYLTTEEMQAALAPVCHFLPEESPA
jgi:hypothetical protein